MSLEFRAHRSEPSSVVHKLPRKQWSFFKDYLKQLSIKETAYVLKKGAMIISFIGYEIKSDMPSGAFIASISVDPKFRGQGLSKLMYKKMLKDLESKKIKLYYGYSKTNQVLKFSKKLGRKPCFYSFKLDKNSLFTLK